MRILPPRLVLIFFVAMLAANALLPGPAVIPTRWQWAGIAPMIAGLAITIAAARHFDRVGTNIRTFDDPTVLVTDGLFARSRNPMYLGFAAFLAGFAVFLGTLVPMILAVAFAVVADRWYVRFEEAAMRRKFGSAYEAYAARTRRWI